MANALLVSYTAILLFFAGMMILPQDMPSYWKWLYRLVYTKYGFGVLMTNTFTSNDAARDAAFDLGLSSVPVLEYYELSDVNMMWWTGVIYIFVAGHLALAYVCNKLIRHQKR